MADASWGVEKPRENGEGGKSKKGLYFTKQMAALYNPRSWTKDRVLEFQYTDIGETYQILMGKDGHEVISENFLPYTTKIVTDLSLWQKIGAGEISGSDAMMDKKYSYDGDFDILLNWEDFFGYGNQGESIEGEESSKEDKKSTNMAFMLIPWILMWISLPINHLVGGIITIIVTLLIQIVFINHKATVYNHLTRLFVSIISLGAILGYNLLVLIPLSYLLFGLMWLASIFIKIPLSAHYSMNDYGYEKAFENKLFMKTNRIISIGWGIAYLITGVISVFILKSSLAPYSGLLSMLVPSIMGIFTVWFQKWYPENYGKLNQ